MNLQNIITTISSFLEWLLANARKFVILNEQLKPNGNSVYLLVYNAELKCLNKWLNFSISTSRKALEDLVFETVN